MAKLYGFDQIYSRIFRDFKNNRLHYCNLLDGTRGIGKNSFAHKVAGLILGVKHDGQEASESAAEEVDGLIKSGGHTDLIMLDVNTIDDGGRESVLKKEEIGIGQVRRVLEKIKLTQSISKNKVVIVDSIDMVTVNGQNALLKVLEEPPANTYFFLICHRQRKVLSTVLSRCNLINVADLELDEWKMAFQSACSANGINCGDINVEYIYYLSDRSVGLALAMANDEAKNMYKDMVKNIFSGNLVNIQKFADSVYGGELLQIFRILIEKFFEDMICRCREKSPIIFEKDNEDLWNSMDKNNLRVILENYEFSREILRNADSYNLYKKHCLTVLMDKLSATMGRVGNSMI
ncbi:MAG: hypothetical protein LBB13_01070 [Rickettsiales bacterium]|nr:hypothetical protein [Rickettsiales bacterium]